MGPSGGIQRLHGASIRMNKYYVPDRVVRYIEGDSNPLDPWPEDDDTESVSSETSGQSTDDVNRLRS